MSRNDTDTYDLIYQTETEKAICVREMPDAEDVWLPKSQIDYEEGAERGDTIVVEIPDRLAEDKGLV
jgi:hypothetical protein